MAEASAHGESFEVCAKSALRRSKFDFSDADMLCAMIKGYADGGDSWKIVDQGGESRWQEAKLHNKKLKEARRREEEVHTQLHKAVAEAYADAQDAYNTCHREYDMLQQDVSEGVELGHAGEGEDLDLCPPWATGPHGEAAEEAARGTNELSRAVSEYGREVDRRAFLLDEKRRLEQEVQSLKAKSDECRTEHKRELDLTKSLQEVSQAQQEIGIPEITIRNDTSRPGASSGTVIVSGLAGAHADEALRTVTVEWATNGRLMRAVPHSSLGLEQEVAEAVKYDDLPSLLTMVWHRICDPSEGRRTKSKRGGA